MKWVIGKYPVSEDFIINLVLLVSVTLLYILLRRIAPVIADKISGKFHFRETLARKLHKYIGTP